MVFFSMKGESAKRWGELRQVSEIALTSALIDDVSRILRRSCGLVSKERDVMRVEYSRPGLSLESI